MAVMDAEKVKSNDTLESVQGDILTEEEVKAQYGDFDNPESNTISEDYEDSYNNDDVYQQTLDEEKAKKEAKEAEEEAEEEARKQAKARELAYLKSVWQDNMNGYGIKNAESDVTLQCDTNSPMFTEQFAAFNDYLAAEHAEGRYNKTFDTLEARFAVRDGVRQDMAQENPAVDKAITDRANHTLNTMNAMYEQGKCNQSDCTYTDKDGNPLKFDFENDYDASCEAIQYGIDHGLINCKLPNGKDFQPPVDEYTQNLEKYDALEADMDKYMSDLDGRTSDGIREKFENFDSLSPEEQAKLIPPYVKAEDREKYINDAIEMSNRDSARFADKAQAYAEGRNPNIEMLQKAGAAFQMEKNDATKAIQAKNLSAEKSAPQPQLQNSKCGKTLYVAGPVAETPLSPDNKKTDVENVVSSKEPKTESKTSTIIAKRHISKDGPEKGRITDYYISVPKSVPGIPEEYAKGRLYIKNIDYARNLEPTSVHEHYGDGFKTEIAKFELPSDTRIIFAAKSENKPIIMTSAQVADLNQKVIDNAKSIKEAKAKSADKANDSVSKIMAKAENIKEADTESQIQKI